MKGVMPQVFVGPDALDDVVRAVEAGLPEGLVIAGPDADALATASRDLVRRLRTDNGQVEFYEPGGTEGLLQATNRLLQDIPLEQLSSSRVSDGMRLLLVLNAEAMGREEAATIRRLAGALRGSALRILLFARLGTVIELHPTLAEFAEAGTCWLLDEKTARRVEVAGIDEVAVAMPPATPPPAAAPATSGQNSPPVPPIVVPPKPVVAAVAKPQDDVDILMQLADERARARGLTNSRRTYSRLFWAMSSLAALVVMAGVGYAVWDDSAERPTGPQLFDCGIHEDPELVRVLQKKLGADVPTKVVDQGGTFHL
ncbi:MAG: hypothetical protein EBZ40_11420, partial [Gammaproteobacteria bacterium]|nr:hypothetical protein [Gammaproteobacteria bacterium]